MPNKKSKESQFFYAFDNIGKGVIRVIPLNLDFFAFTLISPTVGRGLWGKFAKLKKYEVTLRNISTGGSSFFYHPAYTFLLKPNK